MNISSLIGFFVAFLVLWLGVIHPSPNPRLFLDSHALILVCGGTLAAALIGFPARRLIGLFEFVILGLIFKQKRTQLKVAEEILLGFRAMRAKNLQSMVDDKMHPFLIESFSLLNRQFSQEEMVQILEERIEVLKSRYLSEAKMLNAIAKFPPAFGLLGASTGMIVMMTKLGDGGADSIGPAMAIALVATFWGIAIANFVFLPLSDYATKVAADEVQQRRMIASAIVSISDHCSFAFLVEKLVGQLEISDRQNFRMLAREILKVGFADFSPAKTSFDPKPRANKNSA